MPPWICPSPIIETIATVADRGASTPSVTARFAAVAVAVDTLTLTIPKDPEKDDVQPGGGEAVGEIAAVTA